MADNTCAQQRHERAQEAGRRDTRSCQTARGRRHERVGWPEWREQKRSGKGIAGIALGYFLYRVVVVLWTVKDGVAARLPAPILDGSTNEFGSTRSMAEVLFTDHLFPFEAVSVVLLVAVVGAVAVARPSVTAGAQRELAAAKSNKEGGAE